MENFRLDYNSTYISLNLLDELDFVVGGYGKPNAIFLYSLNAFIEAYVLNSCFYISGQEARHASLVSKYMFPNGRPIIELLSNTKSLKQVDGIGNDIAVVIGLGQADMSNPNSYQERIKNYLEGGFDIDSVRNKYLIIPSLNEDVDEINYLNIGKVDDGFVATESKNLPHKFYSKLCERSKNSNVQAVLPFYSLSQHLANIKGRGISRDIITKISSTFQNKQNEIDGYFGKVNQSIPPLVNILLSQCNGIHDIPSKLLQLRLDFSNLRSSVEEYEKKINEAKNIKDQIDAIDELKEFWKVLEKKYSKDSRLWYQFWEVVDESDYDKAIDNAIDTGSEQNLINDLNMGKILGKGAIKAVNWYKERRILNKFQGVTDLWNLFNTSPNVNDHLKNFEKVFDTKIDHKDISLLNQKIKSF